NNPIANMMSKILNAEKIGKRECLFAPISKKSQKVLELLKREGYILDFKSISNQQGGYFVIKLGGKINKCGAISPNFNVKKDGYQVYEKRFLPAKGFGVLLVTTTQGIMTHIEAQEKGLGGRLLAYCY
ncbi:30S ribosomal protein S8, partial [Candidatus Woesearchaeota archaeon]